MQKILIHCKLCVEIIQLMKLMDDDSIKRLFKNQLNNFYSFAYALMPDELQAQQEVIDAMGTVIVLENDKAYPFEEETSETLIQSVYKLIYNLGKKRVIQLGKKGLPMPDSSFYQLDLENRAACFLWQRLGMNFDQIQVITDIEKNKLTSLVHFSHLKMSELSGNDFYHRDI